MIKAKDCHDFNSRRCGVVWKWHMPGNYFHNFKVDKVVAGELELHKLPDHLFGNILPSLMFNFVITRYSCDSFKLYTATIQGLECMKITFKHNLKSRPWNKESKQTKTCC